MTDFSEFPVQSALDEHDLGDPSTPLPGDDVAGTVEQPPVELPSDLYSGPTGSVVVYPGDKWAALAAYYGTTSAILQQLNPDVDSDDDTISGIVSEFRVPVKGGSV